METESKSTFRFFFKASPDGDLAHKEKLARKLNVAIGSEKSNEFLSLWNPGKSMGGFGNYDLDLLFQPSPYNEGVFIITVSYFEPGSDKLVSKLGLNEDAFADEFGEAFDFLPVKIEKK